MFSHGVFYLKDPGSLLLSHKTALIVPSPVEGLTSVFGMGTGVSPLLSPPEKLFRALLHNNIISVVFTFASLFKSDIKL